MEEGGQAALYKKSFIYCAAWNDFNRNGRNGENKSKCGSVYLPAALPIAAQTQHPTAKSGKTAHPIRYKGQTQGVFKKGGV
jgi:hypothetical protein